MDQILCSVCGGQVFKFLGTLGNLRWYRCRNCDADHYIGEADAMDKQDEVADESAHHASKMQVDTNYGAW